MRIAVVGSRHYPDLERVTAYVRGLPAGAQLVTGSAAGVDASAVSAARERGLPVEVIGASFDEFGDAAAGAARNQRLVTRCEVLVAFWDGASEGTRHTVDRALDAGREVHVFTLSAPTPAVAP